MSLNPWPLVAVAAVVVLTFVLGLRGSRRAKTTSDFLVAGRMVKVRDNAVAVSGLYLSAASFLGIAGAVLRDGVDGLWYPVGLAAGHLVLLLLVVAPLRRSGAYTLPDFAEARLGSARLRRTVTVFVVLTCWIYLVPQLQGAGLTLAAVSGMPTWIGAVLVTVVVVATVLAGGMRAVTTVQAAQYWLKLFAMAIPAVALLVVFLMDTGRQHRPLSEPVPPNFPAETTVDVRFEVRVQVVEPVLLQARGTVDGHPVDGAVYWGPGVHQVASDTELRFPAGAAVPVVVGAATDNASWLRPQTGPDGASLLEVYSTIFAAFLGAMGLPHVLIRFYTNPDGRSARLTTLYALGFLGLFYLFPALLGALSRLYTPQLLVTGHTDAAVLLLPTAMLDNWAGRALAALLAAGAFTAFLSVAAGLTVSMAGVLSTDVLSGKVQDFRLAALVSGTMALVGSFVALGLNSFQAVGLALALSASTFCPLLVLGIWWRGLTPAGAVAGMLAGGGLTLVALATVVVSGFTGEWVSPLLVQPAVVTTPLAFGIMWLVSRLTRHQIPSDVGRSMVRMHAPDRLGLTQDRDVQRFGGPEGGERPGPGGTEGSR